MAEPIWAGQRPYTLFSIRVVLATSSPTASIVFPLTISKTGTSATNSLPSQLRSSTAISESTPYAWSAWCVSTSSSLIDSVCASRLERASTTTWARSAADSTWRKSCAASTPPLPDRPGSWLKRAKSGLCRTSGGSNDRARRLAGVSRPMTI